MSEKIYTVKYSPQLTKDRCLITEFDSHYKVFCLEDNVREITPSDINWSNYVIQQNGLLLSTAKNDIIPQRWIYINTKSAKLFEYDNNPIFDGIKVWENIVMATRRSIHGGIVTYRYFFNMSGDVICQTITGATGFNGYEIKKLQIKSEEKIVKLRVVEEAGNRDVATGISFLIGNNTQNGGEYQYIPLANLLE